MKADSGLAKYRRMFDILAVIFLISLLSWHVIRLERESNSSPVQEEPWGVFVFSDYLTLKAGARFYEGRSFYDYTLQNMTVGYPEFSRGWYHYQVPLTNPNSSIYYTHSGPMDGVINGVLQYMGVTSLTRMLEINAALLILALGFWYVSASLLFGKTVGLISVVFMGTSLSAVQFAETICAHGQEWFYAFGAVMLFLLAERATSGRWIKRVGYGGAWVFVFLQAQNTTEFIPWLQIFFIGYLWISRGNPLRAWKLILFMLSASAISLLVHWAIVAGCFGGISNWFRDVTAGLSRRTTGFTEAEEIAWKNFDIRETIPFLHKDLKYRIGMDFVDTGILLALIIGAYYLVRRVLPHGKVRELSAQTKLLLVLLLGGIAFQTVFIQGTVSQTQHMFKTVIPFAGLLIGFACVMVFRYLFISKKNLIIVIPAVIIFLIVSVPIVRDRGDAFEDANLHFPDDYYGRSQAELRILTSFVRENTSYGDIIITNTAIPAYEYLADRRFEVVNDISSVKSAIAAIEDIRQSLPDSNPASKISYYFLLSTESNAEELQGFGEFAKSVGKLQCTLDTEGWWIRHNGGMPDGERKVAFYLYKINSVLVEQWA
ncbi:MAG: hypothetical protein FJZ95_01415 [Chloroflexi bacterium]|nr:hypothetical protein [Chloroflexota bacterium]